MHNIRREYLQQFLDYLKNAGGSVPITQFDDDWEPIGHKVRPDLVAGQLAYEGQGRIYRGVPE